MSEKVWMAATTPWQEIHIGPNRFAFRKLLVSELYERRLAKPSLGVEEELLSIRNRPP